MRTGELKASYRARRGEREGEYEVYSDAQHSRHVEFGAEDMAPQPHLRPAAAKARARLPRAVVEEVRRQGRPR